MSGSSTSVATRRPELQARATATSAPPGPAYDVELLERAYAIVAAASPTHPARSRVEWLVGGHELGAEAIDTLLAHGFLDALDGTAADPRLALGRHRLPVRLLSELAPRRASRATRPT